ncbi:sulfatase [bacterium]|jgi:arylsulfatase A-like enzyme|nr:sulfatase [bacterium]
MVNRRDNKMKIMKPVPDYHDDKEIISGRVSMIFFRYLLINLVLIALSVGRAHAQPDSLQAHDTAQNSAPVIAQGIEKPNVIIFYVDDLGWQDVPLNDLDAPCPYETPNLEKLAQSGISFSQAYASAPSCSPSRVGLLTGQHPAKIGITHVNLGLVAAERRPAPYEAPYLDAHLNRDLLTIADVMKQNGYTTGHVGKWHVGLTASEYGFDFVDHTRGFHRGMKDRTTGFATAADRQYPLSEEKYPPISEKKPQGISYPHDQLTESALKFMDENRNEPFFLNMWHWMVHWPVLTRNGELLEYYSDKMNHPFPPQPGDMTREGQQNPYFGAMVTSVDWSLGRIVDYLEKTDDPRHPSKKLIETTYLFFSSDNGGAERHAREIISDNYPLKHGKTYTEEGGVRVPMVVTGPGISAGSRSDGLVSQLDFFPTIMKLVGAEIAPEHKKELSGLDISPVLTGQTHNLVDEAGEERKSLFWHFPHNHWSTMKSAIREGEFKLYKQHGSGNYELYRLYENGKRADLEEKVDLAGKPEYASVVKRLADHLDTSLKQNHAQGPYLNPNYSPKPKPSAIITESAFDQSSRQAVLRLDPKGPPIHQAYVVYGSKSIAAEKGKKTAPVKNGPPAGVRIPAVIDAGEHSLHAEIPKRIPAYFFILIDKNNFQIFSKEMISEQAVKDCKPAQE